MTATYFRLALALLLATPIFASAQTGLELDLGAKVCLLVETPPSDTAALGVDKQALQNRAELRLRQAGLSLCSATEPQYVYVQVDALPGAFSISVSFNRQVIYFFNGKQQQVFARTWSKGYVGRNLSLLMQTLDLALDAFLIEFQRANSK